MTRLPRRALLLGLALTAATAALAAARPQSSPPDRPNASAHATKPGATFTIFIYEPLSELARRTDNGPDGQRYWGAYMAYAARLTEAGIMLPGGCCLQPDADGVVLRRRDAGLERSAGAHARSPDGFQLGGYFVITAADLDEAVSWAAQAPAVDSAVVEVRASYPMPERTTP